MEYGLAWLPLVSFIILPLTFLTTYIWAVLEGHVEPDFPYISATGTFPPESCFFSLMLNITAVLFTMTVWVRHHSIISYCDQHSTQKNIPRWNRRSVILGYMASFGVALVGNFQATNVPSIHITGAVLAFGVGTIYIWIQAYMSYKLCPKMNSKAVAHLRLGCAITATVMNILTVLFGYLHTQANDEVAYWTDEPYWRHDRNKWGYHVVATTSEWVLAGALCAFIISLVPGFFFGTGSIAYG